MMAGRIYLRQLEDLRTLLTGFSKFIIRVSRSIDNIEISIKAHQEELTKEKIKRESYLKHVYDDISTSKQNFRGTGKSDSAKLREAEEAVQKIKKLSHTLESSVNDYRPYSKKMRQLIDGPARSAKMLLNRSIQIYQNYLQIQDLHDESDYKTILDEGPSSFINILVNSIQSMLHEETSRRVTMSVAIAEDKNGEKIILLSSSERNGFIRKEIKESIPKEAVVVSEIQQAHAEDRILKYAENNELKVYSVAAGRPICSNCEIQIAESGAIFATPLKE